MKDFDILVIGELCVDLILTGEDLQPSFGQAEKLVEDATLAMGSSSAIFACGAARLGLNVIFAGKVGDDDFGRFMLKALQQRGVDTSAIVVDPSIKTGLTLHLSRPHDRAMLTYLGSIAAFRAGELDASLLSRTRHLHTGSYFLQTGIQPDLPRLFAAAHSAGATVSLDPGWDPAEKWNSVLSQALEQVDIFLPNEQEAVAIARSASVESALEYFSNRLPLTVVKMGAEGAIAVHGGENHPSTSQCKSFQVETIETTGAGDSFDAGFIYAHLHGFSIEDRMRWACACGALSTTRIGGTEGQPEAWQVEQLLSRQAHSKI